MGRYAFFKTGFEYKFRFGVQKSEDIRRFGGLIDYSTYSKTGELSHTWSPQDIPQIEEELKRILEWLGTEPVDVSLYEKNLQGTYHLMSDLYDLYKTDHNEEIIAPYILGTCIHHQLLYEEALSAQYES
jgi:hypothetical protein